MIFDVLAVVAGAVDDRSRSYQAHIASEDVDQLRQFIEAGLPQKRTHPRYSGVILQFVRQLPLISGVRVALKVFLQTLVGIDAILRNFNASKGCPNLPTRF